MNIRCMVLIFLATLSSPFLHSMEQPQQEVIEKSEKQSPHDAAAQGNLQRVKEALEQEHFDVNTCDGAGLTLLHLASLGGHLEIVKYLINDCFAHINYPNFQKQTPLHAAALGCNDILLSKVLGIVYEPSNLTSEEQIKEYVLGKNSEKDHRSVILFLLNKGVKKSARDINENKAVDYIKDTDGKPLTAFQKSIKKILQ